MTSAALLRATVLGLEMWAVLVLGVRAVRAQEAEELNPRILCIFQMESGMGRYLWNPQPWGRYGEHAQGWAGWLPSTWATTPQGRAGLQIGDFDAEYAAVQWMLDVGRGREFAGVLWGRC